MISKGTNKRNIAIYYVLPAKSTLRINFPLHTWPALLLALASWSLLRDLGSYSMVFGKALIWNRLTCLGFLVLSRFPQSLESYNQNICSSTQEQLHFPLGVLNLSFLFPKNFMITDMLTKTAPSLYTFNCSLLLIPYRWKTVRNTHVYGKLSSLRGWSYFHINLYSITNWRKSCTSNLRPKECRV